MTKLSPEFLKKLKSTLETARSQMEAYCPSAAIRKIAYVILNYEDMLHMCAPNHARELEAFVATEPVPGLEIVFDVKPPYYAATV